MHLHHATNALLFALNRVIHPVALFHHAGIHPQEGQRSHKRVSRNFKRQSGERRFVIGGTFFHGDFVVQHTLDSLHFGGRRQVFDYRIQHRLNTLVLKRRTAEHRYNFIGQGARTNACLDFFFRQRLTFEVFIHKCFVRFGGRFHQAFTQLFTFSEHVGRDFFVLEGHTLIGFVPANRLHFDQIHNTLEFFFRPDGHLQRHWIGAKSRF